MKQTQVHTFTYLISIYTYVSNKHYAMALTSLIDIHTYPHTHTHTHTHTYIYTHMCTQNDTCTHTHSRPCTQHIKTHAQRQVALTVADIEASCQVAACTATAARGVLTYKWRSGAGIRGQTACEDRALCRSTSSDVMKKAHTGGGIT